MMLEYGIDVVNLVVQVCIFEFDVKVESDCKFYYLQY